jgi:hypothetical protein
VASKYVSTWGSSGPRGAQMLLTINLPPAEIVSEILNAGIADSSSVKARQGLRQLDIWEIF